MAEFTEAQKKYYEYLESEEWSCLRSLAKFRNARNNNGSLTCIDCKATYKKQYDVHHEQYPESRDYYNDDNSSFHVVLCHECHEKRHKKSGDDMMYIKDCRKHSYLALYASYMACNQYCYDEIMNLLKQIDLYEYKALLEFIKDKEISTIISTIAKSDIDKVVISEFIDYVGMLIVKVNRLAELNMLFATKKDKLSVTTDQMDKFFINGEIKKITDEISEINNRIFSDLSIIKKEIKKKINKKRRKDRINERQ